MSGHHAQVVIMHDASLALHIGPPVVRLLPTAVLLDPKREPMVRDARSVSGSWLTAAPLQLLRPRLPAERVRAFVDDLGSLIGSPYDTVRFVGARAGPSSPILSADRGRSMVALVLALVRPVGAPQSLLPRPSPAPHGTTICTDAVLCVFALPATSAALTVVTTAPAQGCAAACSERDGRPQRAWYVAARVPPHQAMLTPDAHPDAARCGHASPNDFIRLEGGPQPLLQRVRSRSPEAVGEACEAGTAPSPR